MEFIKNYGVEIVFEVVRFYVEFGYFSEVKGGKFCIFCVIGFDEYIVFVDNNVYINYMVKMIFEFVIEFYNLLKEKDSDDFEKFCRKIEFLRDEVLLWKNIVNNMYLLYNLELKIIF